MMLRNKILTSLSFVLLACSAWLSNFFLFQQPVRTTSKLTQNIPTNLGQWNLYSKLQPTESEYNGLETTDIIKRMYTDGKNSVFLVIAYIARSNRKSAHAQEACLRGSGAEVSSLEKKSLENGSISATRISINQGDIETLVYYWYKIGDTYTSEFVKSSFLMFYKGLFNKKSHGTALIRISTSLNHNEPANAGDERIENFTKFLMPAVKQNLP